MSQQPTARNDIEQLRTHLFAQLAELRAIGAADPEALKAAISKSAAVSELGKVITDTAKVEVDYLKATGGGESEFLSTAIGAGNLPKGLPSTPQNGITGIVRHRLAG